MCQYFVRQIVNVGGFGGRFRVLAADGTLQLRSSFGFNRSTGRRVRFASFAIRVVVVERLVTTIFAFSREGAWRGWTAGAMNAMLGG